MMLVMVGNHHFGIHFRFFKHPVDTISISSVIPFYFLYQFFFSHEDGISCLCLDRIMNYIASVQRFISDIQR